MKEYYKILEITRDVEKIDIKKAYFKLVRKYPPDRFPEEFMSIREAYEILIDDHTRRQYDAIDEMPATVRLYFDEGRKQLELGNAQSAIKLLESVKAYVSNFAVINSLLGDAYMANENSGKAIQVFEELTAHEPNNAGFIGKLARAYLLRGWHKKATERYKQALLLDEDNISLWLGLIDSYFSADQMSDAIETAKEGIAVSKRKGWDGLELYYHIIQVDIITHDLESMNVHLDEMKSIAIKNEEEKGNVAWFLANLSKFLQMHNMMFESLTTMNAAFEILPEDPEIIKMKMDMDKDSDVILKMQQFLQDDSIQGFFKSMIDFEMHMCDDENCIDCGFEQFSYEMEVVANLEAYIKEIRRIRTEYPEIYKLKHKFFDSILDQKNRDRLMRRYENKMKKFMRFCPWKFESDECDESDDFLITEPYMRVEPKVGRNDPCPCGSGKKYKKCCG